MLLEEAKQLRYREPLIYMPTGKRWFVNGQVKTWKRDPARVCIPLKHGLYGYAYLTEYNVSDFRRQHATQD
jgi:hypothetical protein